MQNGVPGDFAGRIRQLRAQLGLTQAELAARLGVSFSSINRWENAQVRPSELAWRLILRAERQGISALPPPAGRPAPLDRGDGAELFSFVGRDQVVTRLLTTLDRAARGSVAVALLAGEPGIGKTRTAEEFALLARKRGARVLWGRCHEGEGAPAFWPWLQILRSIIRGLDDQLLAAAVGSGAAEISQILPELQPPPALEPEQARFRLFESITSFLRQTASLEQKTGAPSPCLVLIVDDLHWADTPSLLLLQFLARELADAPLLLLGAYRDVEVRRGHPLSKTLAELARAQVCERILLGGLGEADVARFIEVAAGRPPSEALVAAVAHETDGNPFFITEVVRLLVSEGRLEMGARVEEPLAIPQSVHEVVGRRLERLSPTCQQILDIAAVIGREFELSALRQAAEPDAEALLLALQEAEDARLIMPAPAPAGLYRFVHALIRETLYAELGSAQRVRLHRMVGEALERLHAGDPDQHLAQLAHHFFQAASGGDVNRAVDYLERSAERSLRLLAYEEATRHYRMALQTLQLQAPPDMTRHCGLLLSLGEAQRRAGELAAAMESFQWAAAVARSMDGSAGRNSGPALLARAALGYEDALLPTGQPRSGPRDPSILLLEEALAALSVDDSSTRARVLAGLARALYFAGSHARGAALSQAAVDMARRVHDPPALVYALHARRMAIGGPEFVEERLGVLTELVQLADAAGDRELSLEGRLWRLRALIELGDFAAVRAETATYLHLAEELRQTPYLAYAARFRALQVMLDGDLDEVEPALEQALTLGQRAQNEEASMWYITQMCWLRREQGRLAEVANLVQAVQARVDQHDVSIVYHAILANVYSLLGRMAEARRELECAATNGFAELQRDWRWLIASVYLAEVCAALQDTVHGQALYDRMLPFSGRFVVEGARVDSISHRLGQLAATLHRWDDATQHFEAALTLSDGSQSRRLAALVRYDYAAMLHARGEIEPEARERALSLLDQALTTAQNAAMTRLADAAAAVRDDILRSSLEERDGVATLAAVSSQTVILDPRPRVLPDGLTEREAEVLRLIAAGRSNRQVAEALVVSLNTVFRHVTNILTKTGAANRTEAAIYAHRHGLME